MAAYSLITFQDIVNACQETLKIQSTDSLTLNRIRRNINMVYINHVVPAAESWEWLRRTVTRTTDAAYTLGTANVTQNSAVVTLSEIPPVSKTGHFIAFKNVGGIYKIEYNEVGSPVVILETNYNGPTNGAIPYSIWTDSLVMPSECMAIKTVLSSGKRDGEVAPIHLTELRQRQMVGWDGSGFPAFYSLSGRSTNISFVNLNLPTLTAGSAAGRLRTLTFFADISATIVPGQRIKIAGCTDATYNGVNIVTSVNGTSFSYKSTEWENSSLTAPDLAGMQIRGLEQEDSTEGPIMLLHPAVLPNQHTAQLLIDYQIRPSELVSPTDEPLLPVEHRIILFYGAMWLSSDRETDMDRAAFYKGMMDEALQRALNFSQTTPKQPRLAASMDYFARKG